MDDVYLSQDISELFNILESNQSSVVEDVKSLIREHLSSSRESWLVYGLYDYCLAKNSLRTLEILVSIQEPHHKYLFDKIAESLRGNNRLPGLVILGFLIRRQPSWLHKICEHSILRELIRLLKTENDIVVIVHAVLVLTALVPVIPTILSSLLHEFFEIFSRLAAWSFTNQSKVPEVYMLHLQIALYALFHRLYGMYPCNFLAYLRHHYATRDNLQIFIRIIKPMLETVRMHPLLVTGSKDGETGANRWKQMSVHDIVNECAKYSLMEVHETSNRDDFAPSSSNIPALGPPPLSSLLQEAMNPNSEWTSPSTRITTTPASRIATPQATPIKDPETVKQRPPIQPVAARSLTAALDNPPPPTSPLKSEAFKFPDTGDRRGSLIASKMGKNQETPTFRHLSGVISGIRSRHSSGAPNQGLETSPGIGKVSCNTGFDKDSSAEDGEVSRLLGSRGETGLFSQNWSHSRETTPVSQISATSRPDSVIQDKNDDDDAEDLDDDSDSATPSNYDYACIRMASKQNISDFVQRVKRLRYYSHCLPNAGMAYGSPSSNSSMGTVIDAASSGTSLKTPISGTSSSRIKRSNSCPTVVRPENLASREALKPASKGDAGKQVGKPVPLSCTSTQTDDNWPPTPYEHLFLSVLPPSLFYAAQPVVPSLPPTETPAPPSVLLDRYVETAYLNHERQVTLTGNKNSVNEDVAYLKGQILLLHAELQFERQQREVQAERSRRLFSNAKEMRGHQEERDSLRQQVSELQQENACLRKDLDSSRRALLQQENEKNCVLKEHEQQVRKIQQQLVETSQAKQQLEEELQKLRKEERSLRVQVGHLQGELFDLNAEKKELKAEADYAQRLHEQLIQTQHDLLYARETAHQLQQLLQIPQPATAEEKDELARAFKEELRSCKDTLERERRCSEALNARLAEMENGTAKKEAEVAELKRILQAVRDEYDQLMKALEDKYEASKAVTLAMENNVLQLRQQLDGYRSKQRRRLGSSVPTAIAPSETSQLPLAPGFSASPNSPPSFSSTSGTSPEQLSVSLAVEASEGINDMCWQSLEASALSEVAELPSDEQTRPEVP